MKIATILAAILICSIIIAGQENQVLTQAQRVVLDTPEVIALELTPITRRRSAGVYEKVSGPFKPGSKIAFELVGTNTSILSLVVYGWDTYSQNRLLLVRDGQEVPYRKGIDDVLKSKEKEPAMEVIHLAVTHLEPSQPKSVEQIDLSNWYEPLEPGHYQVSARHRFVHAGKWVDSASIVFDVEKKR
jgi:hypothetical protein